MCACGMLQAAMLHTALVVLQACGHRATTRAPQQDQQQQQRAAAMVPRAGAPWVGQTATCGPGTAGAGACLWVLQGLWRAKLASNQVCWTDDLHWVS
jgi:hypothetical protein